MFELKEVIAVMAFGGALVMAGVFAGAWVSFKSKNSVPGESFLGGSPKGAVFTIPDASEELDNGNGAEKSVLERTEEFLKAFGGDKL